MEICQQIINVENGLTYQKQNNERFSYGLFKMVNLHF